MTPVRNPAAAAWAAVAESLIVSRVSAHAPGFDEAWAKVSAVPGFLGVANAAVLWGVVAETRPQTVVEVGSYLGRSTLLFALALQRFSGSDARVHSVDPHTGDRQQMEALGLTRLPSLDLFRTHIGGAGVSHLVVEHVATSREAVATWRGAPLDLAYIDGWHSFAEAKFDTQAWGALLNFGGLICWDDFGLYPEVAAGVTAALGESGLDVQLFGQVQNQAWGGRSMASPACLRFPLRESAIRTRLKKMVT